MLTKERERRNKAATFFFFFKELEEIISLAIPESPDSSEYENNRRRKKRESETEQKLRRREMRSERLSSDWTSSVSPTARRLESRLKHTRIISSAAIIKSNNVQSQRPAGGAQVLQFERFQRKKNWVTAPEIKYRIFLDI